MEEFTELEFKYRADQVKLSDFVALMETLGYKSRKDVSSWDYYYTHAEDKEEFLRFRDSDNPELTIKRKVKAANNWERVEVDLPIDPNRAKKMLVDKWVGLEGYNHNFTIYKSCFIFWQDVVNMVYYIVYDENMVEKGRFIEIEANKDKLSGVGLDFARSRLRELEQQFQKLGIAPQNRLKKSLFEMFVK